ncbi:MAG: glycosyl hydrolase family 65 protein [Acidimicrobiia bacterium]|nr:glycosyl hydrolase family 65 protein [Acidimicrobiia bacterium]MDX2468530.1 glycosyl hydrolase family 65 protein [Acidimicrobiia bacterium]
MSANETPSRNGSEVIDRTFAGFVFDWDGTAVSDRDADASVVRRQLMSLCRQGVAVAIVSGTNVANVDGQLGARPAGPGPLFLCLNRGSEVFRVGATGPELVWRRTATAEEELALTEAADSLSGRLRQLGIATAATYDRLNRRKIDLIPVDEWMDPPKARLSELLDAVTERLQAAGVAGLAEVVGWAEAAATDAGLADPRVTSDVKHVEIGLTDKSHSLRWVMENFWGQGIGPGLVLVAGDEFGDVGGVVGSDALMVVPEAERATFVSVGLEPDGVPPQVMHLGGGPNSFSDILEAQLRRRRERRVPDIDQDPAWTISVDGTVQPSVSDSLLAVGNGLLGTRGGLAIPRPDSGPRVVVAGVYDTGDDGHVRLLAAPDGSRLGLPRSGPGDRAVLDLHTGVVHCSQNGESSRWARFVSLDRPEVAALRAETPSGSTEWQPPLQPSAPGMLNEAGIEASICWALTASRLKGGIVAAASEDRSSGGDRDTVERLVFYEHDSDGMPEVEEAIRGVRSTEAEGFDRLLSRHRAAWASRWHDSGVAIKGDPEMELAARFALFHLHGSVGTQGEAAVGARGLTGPAYAGHVFWDSDVFVLPVLAATHPESARAMLEYRIRRLPAARHAARQEGRSGARFPWESAHDGLDVTPRWAHDDHGQVIPIMTGEQEVHIVADVAWAAQWYADWTGDRSFIDGPGRHLITETARYWASRARIDESGSAHIDDVVGPDEYHESVRDNAFTNVMARWNLRRAAELVRSDGHGGTAHEVTAWQSLADALVDGYHSATGVYEQFEGFFGLEPLVIGEIADPPVAADLLLGRDRVTGAQVVKQADVLMLHHMAPEETEEHSLAANLDFYGPRTAHGSSLSPAIHASLLARAGKPDQALEMLRIAARIDLDDLTGTTGGGLHLATMGGVWQALAFGFAGLRSENGALRIDPELPGTWEELELRLTFRGTWACLRIRHGEVQIETNGVLPVSFPEQRRVEVGRPGARFTRREGIWNEVTHDDSTRSH